MILFILLKIVFQETRLIFERANQIKQNFQIIQNFNFYGCRYVNYTATSKTLTEKKTADSSCSRYLKSTKTEFCRSVLLMAESLLKTHRCKLATNKPPMAVLVTYKPHHGNWYVIVFFEIRGYSLI